MATERLQVILQMITGQYTAEAGRAATATQALGTSARTTSTQTKGLDRQLGNTGFTMKQAVVGGALVAGAAVVSFAKDSIRAATDLGESINAVRVVFGDAADDVLELGENSADSFGLANSEFNAFAVRFSAFAENIAEGDGRKIGDVVEEITGRVADFASVMNIDVPEAAQKFQSGLAGEVEPLRKFGIDVSAAATTQRALELGLAETSGELTEQDKVLARYKLIMEQTDEVAGDFKNTQDDLANATRTLSANFEDFKARAGEELTPAMADLASAGISLFDILDSDVNLGWTQRLSAGIQLITGEGSEAVKTYIDQKTAINDLETAALGLTAVERNARDAFVANTAAMAEAEEVSVALTEANEDLATNLEKVRQEALAVQEDYIGALTEMHGVSEKSWTEMAADVDGYLDGFQEVPKEAGITLDKWAQNFQDQVALQEGFWGDVAELQRLGLHDLANEFINQGPAAAQAAKDAVADPIQAAIYDGIVGGAETSLLALTNQIYGYKTPVISFELSVPELEFITGTTGVTTNQTGSSTYTGTSGGVQTRHSGGPVEAGRAYNWRPGEEMLIPTQDSLVTSKADTDRIIAALGAGGSQQFDISVSGVTDINKLASEVADKASWNMRTAGV